jgi:photosystem II stability/assembly factor-like uncharacterized protein
MNDSANFAVSKLLKMGFIVSILLAACAPATATPQSSPYQTPFGDATPAPYPGDTPSPSQIDAPLVESPSLTSIRFLNPLDGWGVTETQIVRTNDGGMTWYNVTPPGLTETGYSAEVFTLDSNTAWVQIPDRENYYTSGFLYRTSDGGMTWVNIHTPFTASDIHFLDADTGWALADLGVGAGSNAVAVYQTSDGGSTWTRTYTNDPNIVEAGNSLPLGGLKAGIAPLNMQTAFVYGVIYSSGTAYLFRTDDGGATWEQVEVPLPPDAANYELGIDAGQMRFVSATDGFLAIRFVGDTYRLAIYVTEDGGRSWALTPTFIPEGGSADFLSAEEAVVYNGNQFFATRDAARTWSVTPPDVKFGDVFAGMDFVNPAMGWVLTLDPNNHRSLYRTEDGGATWFPIVP